MSIESVRRGLYRSQRALGSYQAARRGPAVLAKRIVRRHVTRALLKPRLLRPRTESPSLPTRPETRAGQHGSNPMPAAKLAASARPRLSEAVPRPESDHGLPAA
jgi:hypothetical protein